MKILDVGRMVVDLVDMLRRLDGEFVWHLEGDEIETVMNVMKAHAEDSWVQGKCRAA